MKTFVIATRRSPLALVQSKLVASRLKSVLHVEPELLKIVTTGDRQTDWALEKTAGKGLFAGRVGF